MITESHYDLGKLLERHSHWCALVELWNNEDKEKCWDITFLVNVNGQGGKLELKCSRK